MLNVSSVFRAALSRLGISDEVADEAMERVHADFRENPVTFSQESPAGHVGRTREQLRDYVSAGISRVVVLSDRANAPCETCSAADGDEFAPRDALASMPIPHRDCGCDGGCRCEYMPVEVDPIP